MPSQDGHSGSRRGGGNSNSGNNHTQIGGHEHHIISKQHSHKDSSRSNNGTTSYPHNSQNNKPGKLKKHVEINPDGDYSSGKYIRSEHHSPNVGSPNHQGSQNSSQKHNKHIRQDYTWNGDRNNISFSGNGSGIVYDAGKSRHPQSRILSAEKGRVIKHSNKRAFGAVCRGNGRDSSYTAEQLAQPEGKPFSSALNSIARSDASLLEEREHIKKFLLTNYTSIREDTPNLAYLVEMCLNSPSRDLHQVIRTHAFLDLMQYGDMENISSELLHFYVGISQCRGGHGYMGDDVVMCDCDGRVPLCFTLAFTSLLRDYLEMKKHLDSVCKTLDSFKSGSAPLKVAQTLVEPFVETDDDEMDYCIS
ncbi:hypothetical protein F503_08248 [Ophiostoma piceae UAMH 11346]|uniref:Uncharacterized protein n=1 Tax=Ophiostoma piceae (strain UAMH 11346) TaxID=1262450 RepID=S3BYY4_OPHP1|nr:hypothetical protein F503_08248 [Ophiostoma piceae UAMH 11346]